MIVRTADYLSGISGKLDDGYYLRRIPGRPGYSVKCKKPEFDETKKDRYRNARVSLVFKEANVRARAEYRDPEKRAIWEAKYAAAKADFAKRGKSIEGADGRLRLPARLWEYVRREIIKEMSANA